MFKQNKTCIFIAKYGFELFDNDFDELEDFLNKINKFPYFIKKLINYKRKKKNIY